MSENLPPTEPSPGPTGSADEPTPPPAAPDDEVEQAISPMLLLFCAVAFAVGLGGWYASGFMPGSLQIDASGEAWGTGTHRELYASGNPRLEQRYVGGVLEWSRWYKPDGTLLHETDWTDGTGIGLVLREDGSPEVRMQFVDGVPHGKAIYFDRAGTPVRIVEFVDGEPVREARLTAPTAPSAPATTQPATTRPVEVPATAPATAPVGDAADGPEPDASVPADVAAEEAG